MRVPFIDLKRGYNKIKDEVNKEITDVLENTSYVLGPKVQEFEKNFAHYCGSRYAVAVNSGTSALLVALVACGIRRGDCVIIPSNTFVATMEAVEYIGAIPVCVDVDEHSYNLSVDQVKDAMEKYNIRAIIPVHMHGRLVNNELFSFGIPVIEDACQAHGAYYESPDQRAGSYGDVGCFSFYPVKNLGAYGEGGMVVTDRKDVYDKALLLRDHGSPKKYEHSIVGYNARMDGIQGAVLNVKLKYLDENNSLRRQKAELYRKYLPEPELFYTMGTAEPHPSHVFHVYAPLFKKRDDLAEHLKSSDIGSMVHYPMPIPALGCFKGIAHSYTNTLSLSNQMLSLPLYPEITEEEIEYVAENVKEFYHV